MGCSYRIESRGSYLARAFPRSRVVAIFAHTPAGLGPSASSEDEGARRCIELRDGPVSVKVIADQIPNAWDGIVDFIACESPTHAHALKHRHPGTTFIVNRRHASPVLRLRRFAASIALLRQRPRPDGWRRP